MEDTKIRNLCHDDNAEDQDYIDLEVNNTSSNSTFPSNFHLKKTSPPSQQEVSKSEFEFKTFNFNTNYKDYQTELSYYSTADELFYNGKLLPLDHLPPPRLQMLEKNILENYPNYKFLQVSTSFNNNNNNFEHSFRSTTSRSCDVSRELNPKDYFFNENEMSTKRSSLWSRKLKLIKHFSSFSSKLKCPNYIKSLINKSESCPLRIDNNVDKSTRRCRRKSFSEAIKKLLPANKSSSLSSSSSKNSNGIIEDDMHLLMRSRRNVYPEDVDHHDHENPIQDAIAHCKNSQQQIKFHTKMISEEQETPRLSYVF